MHRHTFTILALAVVIALLPACNKKQEPFTRQEFDRFIGDARVVKHTTDSAEEAYRKTHGVVSMSAMSTLIAGEVEKMGWDTDRYFYIYNRCVSYGAYVYATRASQKARQHVDMIQEVTRNGMPEDYTRDMNRLMEYQKKQQKALRDKVNTGIPPAELKLMKRRTKDIMHIVRRVDMMRAIPEIKS